MRYVFVMGSARAGTTEMANLLNKHHQVIVGRERFARSKHPTLEHFESGSFFTPTVDEAYTLHSEWYATVRDKYEAGGVSLMGDKVPYYTRVLPWLEEEFTKPAYIYLLRDPRSVANSYERRKQDPADHWKLDARSAIAGWNESVRVARDFIQSGGRERMLVLVYEWFYSGDLRQLLSLERFLGLEHSGDLQARFERQTSQGRERMARGWPAIEDQVDSISDRADWDAADELRLVAAEQLALFSDSESDRGWAGPDALAPPDDLLEVTSSALRARLES